MPTPYPKVPPNSAAKPEHPPGSCNLHLQTFTYESRKAILPALSDAMNHCGCWLLDRKVVSLSQTDFVFEIQQRSILELYSSLIGAGLELTRGSHLALTNLCALLKHGSRVSSRQRVVHVELEVSFLEDVDLKSILTPGAASA
jgi:hypothetical protein